MYWFLFTILFVFVAAQESKYEEHVAVKQLENDKVLVHFQFTNTAKLGQPIEAWKG